MTPEEFATKMQAIKDRGNWEEEENHIDADQLMLECLKSLGYGDGCNVFRSIEKWYH